MIVLPALEVAGPSAGASAELDPAVWRDFRVLGIRRGFLSKSREGSGWNRDKVLKTLAASAISRHGILASVIPYRRRPLISIMI
jgi:hypothetical protein